MPTWGVAMAALTIVVAVLCAVRVVPTPLLIVPFVAASIARRFAVVPTPAEIDTDGLWLGDALAAPRSAITDVWFDAEDREIRVAVASKPDRLLVIHLPNREQAQRFVAALVPAPHAHRVAGVRPNLVQAVVPLRFLGVAVAYWVTSGSPVAALLVLLFAIGSYGLVIGAQIDAGDDALELHRLRGSSRIPYSEIASVESDSGVIRLRDRRVVTVAPRTVRDPLLGTNDFTRRAHARALAHLAARISSS